MYEVKLLVFQTVDFSLWSYCRQNMVIPQYWEPNVEGEAVTCAKCFLMLSDCAC